MKSIRKKLIMSIFAIAMLVVTGVTTTYAWFSMNDSAWVDGFDLELRGTDHLLISYEDASYMQSLSNEDVVKAINALRTEDNKLSSLDDIVLEPVTSFDGKSFKRQVMTYDSMNHEDVSYDTALVNSYVRMKLYFKLESAGAENPVNYVLRMKQYVPDQAGIKGTHFSADNQTITLLNSLVGLDGTQKKQGDEVVVNPTNAMRISIIGASESNAKFDRIFEIADENDLGSYAFSKTALDALSITDGKYDCSKNAMYTYFNNIHSNCLEPMDSIAQTNEVSDLLTKRLTNQLDETIGTFVYDKESKSYNTLAIELAVWVEGFDADNIIGLMTSSIDCLLSFEAEAVQE